MAVNAGPFLDESDNRSISPDLSNDAGMGANERNRVRWGWTNIPDEVDSAGHVTKWRRAIIDWVDPFVEEGRSIHGGSGVLDSSPATHEYIRFMAPHEPARPDPVVEEQRRWYLTDNIDHLSPDDSDDSSDESNTLSDVGFGPRGQDGLVQEYAELSKQSSRLTEATSDASANRPALPTPTDQREPPQASQSSTGAQHGGVVSSPLANSSSASDVGDDVLVLADLWSGLQVSVTEGSSEVVMAGEQAPEFPSDGDSVEPSNVAVFILAREELPSKEAQTIIAFDHGSNVTISPGAQIPISHPAGTEPRTLPLNPATLERTIWDIVSAHRITSVRTAHTLASPDRRNISWIHQIAPKALSQSRPSLAHYQTVQSLAADFPDQLPHDRSVFVYETSGIFLLASYDLLRFPLPPTPAPQSEWNLSISQFIKRIYIDSKYAAHVSSALRPAHRAHRIPQRTIPDTAAFVDEWERPERTEAPASWDHYGTSGMPGTGVFDLQDMRWEERVGISRDEARELRQRTCQETRNLSWDPEHEEVRLPLEETLSAVNFVPKSMTHVHRPTITHFQLRNLVAVRSHLQLLYPAKSRLYTELNYSSRRTCVLDLSRPDNRTVYAEPVQISCLGLSSELGRNVVVVGGIGGEYAVKRLNAYSDSDNDVDDDGDETGKPSDLSHSIHTKGKPEKKKPRQGDAVGFVSRASADVVVNHIDVDVHAAHGQFHAVIACNDRKMRTLDVGTGTWLHSSTGGTGGAYVNGSGTRFGDGTETGWIYPWPINCSAASPDGRLRVLVGDTKDVVIASAASGRCERLLAGVHHDYGFACAWSPDGRFVATASQDRKVNIFDTRSWRLLNSWSAHGIGYRSLKFSPVGGGARALLCAEPADRVSVVNAITFEDANSHSFFGEIAGTDWLPDGSGFVVGNSDEVVGGFMEYERRGLGERSGLAFQRQRTAEVDGDEYLDVGPDEWIADSQRWLDARVADPGRRGLGGNWWRSGLEVQGWNMS